MNCGNDDTNSQRLYEEAVSLYGAEQKSEARAVLGQIIDQNGNFAPAFIMLGKLDFYSGDYATAETRFSHALDNDPYSINALFWLGRARMQHKDPESRKQALADFDLVIERDSTHIDAWYNKGLLHEQAGENDLAIAAYRSATQHASRAGLAHLQLGILYEKAGLHKQADHAFQKAQFFTNDPDIQAIISAARKQRKTTSQELR